MSDIALNAASPSHGDRFGIGPPPPVGRIRLHTLIVIRWIAIAGQTLALLIVNYALQFPIPIVPAFAVVGLSALLNISVSLRYPRSKRVSDVGGLLYLSYDILQLAALLYLTGGLVNPFSLLFLAPVTISATTLSLRSIVILIAVAIAMVSLLAVFHFPLPWHDTGFVPSPVYVAGIWTALVLGMLFVAVYAFRISEESRRMQDALAATQIALAREQKLSALGALAAAAAHELGTPLNTILLVARDIAQESPSEKDLAEDARLIADEANRCARILSRLSRSAEARGEASFDIATPSVLLRTIAEERPHQGKQIDIRLDPNRNAEDTEPQIVRRPEIIHGLDNIIENALDFADSEVTVTISWNRYELAIVIEDDGPGIPFEILTALGEPYVTSRPGTGGMGLGVFIAMTLIAHTGGDVTFSNRREGGAKVVISWPLDVIRNSLAELEQRRADQIQATNAPKQ